MIGHLVRDCCDLTGISSSGGSLTFGYRVDLGRYKQPVQYGRESAHKSWALGNYSSLGEYMFEIHHINEEENVLINGTREKSAVGDSAEPKQ